MKVSEFKSVLTTLENVVFQLPNGIQVPHHFHVTEVGLNQRYFFDCGGELRSSRMANMQLWVANDLDHRLSSTKLIDIINKTSQVFQIDDLELEVEYQMETINKFGVEFNGRNFVLTPKFTDCLAKDKCGIPQEQLMVNVVESVKPQGGCCTPGSGCC